MRMNEQNCPARSMEMYPLSVDEALPEGMYEFDLCMIS
jgi:hypothetical protein